MEIDFDKTVQPLLNLPVNHAWKGYGSTIFLELGELSADEKHNNPKGEFCISINWDWRIEHHRSVLFGSSNRSAQIANYIQRLNGISVRSIDLFGQVPELIIEFSNNWVLRSMVMVTGEPDWDIRIAAEQYLAIRQGRLSIGNEAIPVTPQQQIVWDIADRTTLRWGKPIAQPKVGECRNCQHLIQLDGEGHFLLFGVCISEKSPFDGRVV